MKFSSALLGALVAGGTVLCHAVEAQTRWCDVRGVSGAENLYRPVLARAAHESGPVLLRATFRHSGEVTSTDIVSGSPVLARFTQDAVSHWHLTTNAYGDELCQTLAVVDYVLLPTDNLPPPRSTLAPGMLKFTVSASSLEHAIPLPAVRPKRLGRRRQ